MTLMSVDASNHTEIGDDAIDAFRRDGMLVLRNLLGEDELEVLRAETAALVDEALGHADTVSERPPGGWSQHTDANDVAYRVHTASGRLVPFRQEYVIARSAACRRVLGHPFVIRSMQRLVGPDVTPTWDSMVFKAEGMGAVIPWHRDDEFAPDERRAPVANVDVYLDGSDASNALWAIPGSHHWNDDRAADEVRRRNANARFVADGAVVMPMHPGDALFHDIGVLHGSPPAESWLRRVLYYEFRSATDIIGRTHNARYCVEKQRMLARVLAERAAHTGEPAPEYAPTIPQPLDVSGSFESGVDQRTRFAHEDYRP